MKNRHNIEVDVGYRIKALDPVRDDRIFDGTVARLHEEPDAGILVMLQSGYSVLLDDVFAAEKPSDTGGD